MPTPLRKIFETNRQRFEEAQEIVAVHLRHLLRAHSLVDPAEIGTRVSARVKHSNSVIRKVRLKERHLGVKIRSLRRLHAHIDDLAGARVVCDYLTDIALIIGYLRRHHAFDVLTDKIEDYISNPKNGYRGFHLVVWVDTSFGKTKCEVQIQTALQHAWAAKSHTLLYKLQVRDLNRIPAEIRQLMENQSDMLYNIDQMAAQVSRAVRRHVRSSR